MLVIRKQVAFILWASLWFLIGAGTQFFVSQISNRPVPDPLLVAPAVRIASLGPMTRSISGGSNAPLAFAPIGTDGELVLTTATGRFAHFKWTLDGVGSYQWSNRSFPPLTLEESLPQLRLTASGPLIVRASSQLQILAPSANTSSTVTPFQASERVFKSQHYVQVASNAIVALDALPNGMSRLLWVRISDGGVRSITEPYLQSPHGALHYDWITRMLIIVTHLHLKTMKVDYAGSGDSGTLTPNCNSDIRLDGLSQAAHVLSARFIAGTTDAVMVIKDVNRDGAARYLLYFLQGANPHRCRDSLSPRIIAGFGEPVTDLTLTLNGKILVVVGTERTELKLFEPVGAGTYIARTITLPIVPRRIEATPKSDKVSVLGHSELSQGAFEHYICLLCL